MKPGTPFLRILLAFLALGLALSACQASGGAANRGAAEIIETPQSSAEGASSPQEAGAFDLPDPAAGLEGFGAYSAVLTLKFEGTRDGAPAAWTRTYRMTAAPGGDPLRQVEVTYHDGAGEAVTRLSAAESGAAQYLLEEGECQVIPLDEAVGLAERWEPARLLPALAGAQPGGEETIQGAAAQRFTFDEGALGLAELATADGALWTAQGGGALLRYMLTLQGGEEYFGEGISGSLAWDYALNSLDPGQEPALPGGCAAQEGVLDVPLPPDAEEISRSGVLVVFKTGLTAAEILAFYDQALAGADWLPGAGGADAAGFDASMLEGLDLDEETLKELQELQAMQDDELWQDGESSGAPAAAVTDPSGGALAEFHRGEERLTITILPEPAGASVFLVLMEP